MSAPFQHQDNPRLLPSLVVAGVAWAVFNEVGPVTYGPQINPVAAITGGIAVIATGKLLMNSLTLLSRFAEWKRVHTPKGHRGTARFVTKFKEIKHALIPRRWFRSSWGPYWGTFKGNPIFADYASNSMTLGPSGSGKSVGSVIPMILAIHDSALITDFKTDLCVITKRALEQRGETVHVINLGGLYTNILGDSACYNPIDNVTDNLHRPGGINDITSDIAELCYKLLDEPSQRGGSADNIHFRDGARSIIGCITLIKILILDYAANLGEIQLALSDRNQMVKDTLWVAGKLQDKEGQYLPAMPLEDAPWVRHHDPEDVERFIRYVRAQCLSIAEILMDTETDEARSFLTGARQALAKYNPATYAHRVTSRSTVRFRDTKIDSETVKIFIAADASRIQTQSQLADIIQWAAMLELKRADNKHKPVYFIADEATNFRIDPDLLTWGRGYGIRTHLIFQSINAFKNRYSAEEFEMLWSETEIKQILPGIREPEALELIENQLGVTPIMTANDQGQRSSGRWHLDGYGVTEDGRALRTQDELRRSQKGLLSIRDNRFIENDLPPYGAIEPFRSQADINPHYGTPYLLPVKLNLRSRDGSVIARAWRWLQDGSTDKSNSNTGDTA